MKRSRLSMLHQASAPCKILRSGNIARKMARTNHETSYFKSRQGKHKNVNINLKCENNLLFQKCSGGEKFFQILVPGSLVSCFNESSTMVSKLDGYNFKPKLFYYKTYLGSNYPFHYVLANYLYYLPETFNEEMLIGALLLLGLERRFKKSEKNFIAIGVAIIFSLMHQGLFKWSPVQSGELLTLTTIVTLFFVGILRNSLILKTRNIAMSWAIHISFNMVFFSGLFINGKTGNFPGEPEVFNIVFGNLTMLISTGLIASISIIWLNIDKLKKEKTRIENM